MKIGTIEINMRKENPKEIMGIYRTARRYFYLIFRKKKLTESLKKRKGKCKNCGCCKIMIIPCKYFKNNQCSRWNNLPKMCKIYPFDEKDKTNFAKKHCGFYWE